jgi:hypothetical protein
VLSMIQVHKNVGGLFDQNSSLNVGLVHNDYGSVGVCLLPKTGVIRLWVKILF